MESTYTINVETSGFEEATEQIETLAEAYDGFPAQVVVKNCRDCKINIYPSQTKFYNPREKDEQKSRRYKDGEIRDAVYERGTAENILLMRW